jgi:hypothetical protein
MYSQNALEAVTPTNEDARDRNLWRLDVMNSQVAWTMHRPDQPSDKNARFLAPASSNCAGVENSGFLEFPASATPSDESPGFPGFRTFQRSRR